MAVRRAAQLREQVKRSSKVIPLGNGTKRALGQTCLDNVQTLPVAELAGIIEYDPTEFLITAAGGTTIQSMVEALQQHGQYMPFDPLFVSAGATLGGTIASGISGPRRLLHGGLRDFVMEVELIDGLGEFVRGGGKVVKNAAGFDLPKLMVGSYGRLGIITEATLKVLPEPAARVTVKRQFEDFVACIAASQKLLAQSLPISAIEIDSSKNLWIELAGLAQSLPKVVQRAQEILACELDAVESLQNIESKLDVEDSQYLLRAATNPSRVAVLAEQLASMDDLELLSISSAGSTAWIKSRDADSTASLDALLRELGFSGVVVRGSVHELTLLGNLSWTTTAHRIQGAVDPHERFLPFSATP